MLLRWNLAIISFLIHKYNFQKQFVPKPGLLIQFTVAAITRGCDEWSSFSGPCIPPTENEVSWLTPEISSWTWRGEVVWLPWRLEWRVPPRISLAWESLESTCFLNGYGEMHLPLPQFLYPSGGKLILSACPFFYVCPSVCLSSPSVSPWHCLFIYLCSFIQYLLSIYSIVLGSGT